MNGQTHEGGLEFMELGQVVILREVSELYDKLQYDKTRPYKHFPALTEKLILLRNRGDLDKNQGHAVACPWFAKPDYILCPLIRL